MSADRPASKPESSETQAKNIRSLSRLVTTHNDSGEAVFAQTIEEDMPMREIGDGVTFSLAYTTDEFPAKLNGDRDIESYKKYLSEPPGLVVSSGTVCRIVDMPPRGESAMHRTVSLDYGVVLEGEVELVLDSGETRLMKRGDVAIQRGTNHAWKNVTPDVEVEGKTVGVWARMLYVLSAAQPIEVSDHKLGEAVEGIAVRSST